MEIATNILIAYCNYCTLRCANLHIVRVGTSCPYPYGWAWPTWAFLSFFRVCASYFRGFEGVYQRRFFHHFADVGKMASEWWPRPEQASILGDCDCGLNCQEFLGSWTFRKFRKVSVTKCNRLTKISSWQNVTVLIRPNSADLDYVFQQSGNKSWEVVFNSGEFARIRLICAFFLFILQCAKIAHFYLCGIPPN